MNGLDCISKLYRFWFLLSDVSNRLISSFFSFLFKKLIKYMQVSWVQPGNLPESLDSNGTHWQDKNPGVDPSH